MGVIEGTDLADEYVMVGAHYDHVTSCEGFGPTDTICNGATDNATGVAAVLDIARSLARTPTRPLGHHRSLGPGGGRPPRRQPLRLEPAHPPRATVTYVNFDILGANLLPALRTTHFAIGAETGGAGSPAPCDRRSAASRSTR